MNIRFNSLKLENFFSYQNATISFDKTGYTLITGINHNINDNAKSNGSGKSAIWEGITWCLTGTTIRGTKDVKNFILEGPCVVTVDFNIGNDNYVVTRTKDPSNLIILINGDDKSGKGIRDSEQLLKEYIPDLTPSLIGSVIILGQGLPMRFTNNSPSGRKEVLEKLSESDFMIADLKDRVSKRKNVIDKDIRDTQDELLELNTKLALNTSNLNDYKDKLEKLNSTNIYDLNSSISQTKLKEQEVLDKLNKFNSDLESVSTRVEKNKFDITSLTECIRDEKSSAKTTLFTEKAENSLKLDSINNEIIRLEDEIKKLQEVKEFCPTCGQRMPDYVKPDTTALELELSNKNKEFESVSQIVKDVTKRFNESDKVIDDKYFKDVAKLNLDKTALDQECATIKYNTLATQEEYTKVRESLATLIAELNNLENNIKDCEAKITELTEEINSINESILYNNNRKENLDEHKSALAKMESVLSRDFRGYLLSNVIDFVNTVAKKYSQEVFGTDKINFELEGNNLFVSYDGKKYENLSGGERCRCDIIIQLALRQMLCTYLDFSSNILCVDEVFDSLDSIGCEKITNLLFNRLPDVENVYIITHRADLPISCDNELIITKDENGISHIGD